MRLLTVASSKGDFRERDRRLSIFEWLILACAAVIVVMGAYGGTRGDTANSRLATVLSLTRDGTWYIDRPIGEEPNYFEARTIDKVFVKGRLLSTKPPVLPLIMTGEYVVLKGLFGWDLDTKQDHAAILRALTITLCGFSYVGALLFFALTLSLFISNVPARCVSLFSLAFATQLWGYGSTINNHVPAAFMVVVALYLALSVGSGKRAPAWWRFFLFGLCGGLVPTLDMPAGIFVAFAGFYLLWKFPRQTLTWTMLGAAIPLATHFAVMISVTGSPLPVQMRNDLYLYEASYWRNPRGVDGLNEPKGTYLFHMTLGRSGLFSLYPILLAGLASGLRALARKEQPYRGAILAGFLAFIVLTAYYVSRTNNYGGEAYGFRWYIVAMPVLLLMAAPFLASIRGRWKWLFITVMVGISVYSGWECHLQPWGANGEWTRYFLGSSY